MYQYYLLELDLLLTYGTVPVVHNTIQNQSSVRTVRTVIPIHNFDHVKSVKKISKITN